MALLESDWSALEAKKKKKKGKISQAHVDSLGQQGSVQSPGQAVENDDTLTRLFLYLV